MEVAVSGRPGARLGFTYLVAQGASEPRGCLELGVEREKDGHGSQVLWRISMRCSASVCFRVLWCAAVKLWCTAVWSDVP